jgi:DNA polymerase-3 subunit gamma/tau
MTKGSSDAADTRALYRKYRSTSLTEVVGQDHITDILSRALKQGKIAHAYLFTGPRGVGKTSIARILAYEINQIPYDETTQHPDIIEIDAASNRRIDDIRDLRDKVQIAPALAKYKVYIIDEVHMLTGESFNAFLKTLEEPPAHVVFILATTDAHKLPVTITSRTQRFSFRSIAPDVAQAHLRSIADKEGILIDDDALELVAMHGDGSFRDSISLLDQLSGLQNGQTPISRATVESLLGMAAVDQITALMTAYTAQDAPVIIAGLTQFEQVGIAPTVVANQLMQHIRASLVTSPALLPLLDKLVGVASSAHPDISLLTALLAPSTPTPAVKTVAQTVAPAPELAPLVKEAARTQPSERHLKKALPATPPAAPTPRPATTKAAAASPKPEPAPEQPRKKRTSASVAFSWDDYLAYMREHQIALASILVKCKAEYEGDTLTLWKKKLDDIRYQPVLHDALAALDMPDCTIETIPATAPPKDSKAAAVAAIMGGGEEVEV